MEALSLLVRMDWPAAVALIGLAAAVSVPLIVRRSLLNIERIEQLKLRRAIQLEAFKKGSLSTIEEPRYD